MNLLRWNNAQRPQGKSVEPSASHSGQGLEVKKRFSLPVEGEVFSLTFPFIEQAIIAALKALRHPKSRAASTRAFPQPLKSCPDTNLVTSCPDTNPKFFRNLLRLSGRRVLPRVHSCG